MLYKPQDKLLGETIYDASGSVTDVLDFAYDWNGQPFSVKYNGATYFYVLNLQGDVVRIVDGGGTSYGVYRYDAWGNILYSTNNTLMNINPLRYRGYYYDTETGFYYLQSRYYDPSICRFINADSYVSTGQGIIGSNMFAYCGNNPACRIDSSGQGWEEFTDWLEGVFEEVEEWVEDNIVEPIEEITTDVMEDCENFDKNNESEEVVVDSNYFSSYKGTLVIKTSFDASFSYGIIGLSELRQTSTTLNHEYGHIIQQKNMGLASYTSEIAIPSIMSNVLDRMGKLPYDYYGSPWEAEADSLGGVHRNENNTPWPDDFYDSYWDLLTLFFQKDEEDS